MVVYAVSKHSPDEMKRPGRAQAYVRERRRDVVTVLYRGSIRLRDWLLGSVTLWKLPFLSEWGQNFPAILSVSSVMAMKHTIGRYEYEANRGF